MHCWKRAGWRGVCGEADPALLTQRRRVRGPHSLAGNRTWNNDKQPNSSITCQLKWNRSHDAFVVPLTVMFANVSKQSTIPTRKSSKDNLAAGSPLLTVQLPVCGSLNCVHAAPAAATTGCLSVFPPLCCRLCFLHECGDVGGDW